MRELLPIYPLFFLGFGAYQSWNNHHAQLVNQQTKTIEQLALIQQIFSQGVFDCVTGAVSSAIGVSFLGGAFLSGVGTAMSHEPSKKTLFKMSLFGISAAAIGATALAYGCTNIGKGSMDIYQSLNASRP